MPNCYLFILARCASCGNSFHHNGVPWPSLPNVRATLVQVTPNYVPTKLTCEQCDGEFKSAAALKSHRAETHGQRQMARTRVDSCACPACGTVSRNICLALDHLAYRAKHCFQKAVT